MLAHALNEALDDVPLEKGGTRVRYHQLFAEEDRRNG